MIPKADSYIINPLIAGEPPLLYLRALGRKTPHTDDMRQMLDDLGVPYWDEVEPYYRHALASVLGSLTGRGFEPARRYGGRLVDSLHQSVNAALALGTITREAASQMNAFQDTAEELHDLLDKGPSALVQPKGARRATGVPRSRHRLMGSRPNRSDH
jgi:hypothetical protein